MGSDIDRDALAKACEAFHAAEVKFGRLPKFQEDSMEAAILAYREAMEAKMRPAEDIAFDFCNRLAPDGSEDILELITAAILADRKERA